MKKIVSGHVFVSDCNIEEIQTMSCKCGATISLQGKKHQLTNIGWYFIRGNFICSTKGDNK